MGRGEGAIRTARKTAKLLVIRACAGEKAKYGVEVELTYITEAAGRRAQKEGLGIFQPT